MPSLYYRDYGNGFPVVFLHGFCETHEVWRDFENALKDNFRILSPDLPGFGKSPWAGNKFSLKDIADILYQWLTELELTSCIMIGHSMGGYIMLEFADKHPEMLRGLGLFHSSAFPDNPEKKENRKKTMVFVRNNGVKPFVDSFVPSLFYEGNHKKLANEIEKYRINAELTPRQTIISYTEAMMNRTDRTDILKNFKGPVLLIAGEEDQAVPLSSSKELAIMAPNTHPFFLKETGHMGMIEKKSKTIEIVKNFLIKTT